MSISITPIQQALWVVRHDSVLLSYHTNSHKAARWLNSHATVTAATRMRITKSFLMQVGYTAPEGSVHNYSFPPVHEFEAPSFSEAMTRLVYVIQKMWDDDYVSHPSREGRIKADDRWLEPHARIHTAALSIEDNPSMVYDMKKLSPVEGRGRNLRLQVVPTPEAWLKGKVRHHV